MTFSNILKHKWKVLAALALLLLPVIVPEMLVHLTIEIIIFSLFAISMNLVLRGVGLLSFGHAAFFGVGAYALALIGKQVPGMPLLLILALAAVTGFVFALLIGSLCVRARPAYFPLLTLAFQMLLFAVALKWRALTGGDDGMGLTRPDFSLPFLGKISLLPVNNLYFFTLIIAALAIIGCYFLLKTPLGNSFVCIRENALRAPFAGYNVYLTKLAAFSISGFLAGLAGGLYALFQEFVATSSIDLHLSFNILMMVLIGGVIRFLGPVLGVAFMVLFQHYLSGVTSHWPIFVGIVFIVVIRYLNRGLIELFDLEMIRSLFKFKAVKR